jgi:hypothetical protein
MALPVARSPLKKSVLYPAAPRQSRFANPVLGRQFLQQSTQYGVVPVRQAHRAELPVVETA